MFSAPSGLDLAATSAAYDRRNFLRLSVAVTAGLLLTGCEGSGNHARSPAGQSKEGRFSAQPVWEQDFTQMPDGELDPRYWNVDTGNLIPSYNDEAETLTDRPENVRIQDGLLIIEAKREHLRGQDFTSARVNTQSKFSFQYGKLEVDLKVPKGIGTWPAAWLLPNGAKYKPQDYGIDPSSDTAWALNGEIDFCEAVGSQPGAVYPDTHSYDSVIAQKSGDVHIDMPNAAEVFNTFGVELTPGSIAFTHNGDMYHRVKKTSDDPREWPFDQPYHLTLNLAMGGSWGGEKKKQYPPDGIQGDGPWQLAVRAIRYHDVAA